MFLQKFFPNFSKNFCFFRIWSILSIFWLIEKGKENSSFKLKLSGLFNSFQSVGLVLNAFWFLSRLNFNFLKKTNRNQINFFIISSVFLSDSSLDPLSLKIFLSFSWLVNWEQNMSSLCVKQCLKVYVSSFKFELTVEKGSHILPSSTDREIRFDQSRIAEIRFCIMFKQGPNPQKFLGFHSNLSTYKRETLATFFRPLKDLCVTLYEMWEVLYILTTQESTRVRSTIK